MLFDLDRYPRPPASSNCHLAASILRVSSSQPSNPNASQCRQQRTNDVDRLAHNRCGAKVEKTAQWGRITCRRQLVVSNSENRGSSGIFAVGPEAKLQLAVQSKLDELFPPTTKPVWTGGSVPLGAGIPDIVRAVYEPEITALTGADSTSLAVLAYLRTVGKARRDTISLRLCKTERAIRLRLAAMEAASILTEQNSSYVLASKWRCVLPEVLSIEVKVAGLASCIVSGGKKPHFLKQIIRRSTRKRSSAYSRRRYIQTPWYWLVGGF